MHKCTTIRTTSNQNPCPPPSPTHTQYMYMDVEKCCAMLRYVRAKIYGLVAVFVCVCPNCGMIRVSVCVLLPFSYTLSIKTDVDLLCQTKACKQGCNLKLSYSNVLSALIDWVHDDDPRHFTDRNAWEAPFGIESGDKPFAILSKETCILSHWSPILGPI